jgi:hypothetical protein
MNSARSIHRTPTSTWLARVALLLNLSLGLSYVGLWLMLAQQDLFWPADFSAYYTGWAIVRDGLGDRLYDFELQTRYQQQILEGRSFSQGLLPYLNPPHATLPFVPLALLSRGAAFWVWSLVQAALVVWLFRFIWRLSKGWAPGERWLLVAAVAAFPPLLFSIQLGAFSLLMLVCLLQYYSALKQGRERRAGLWLLLGTIKPQIMLLPGSLLLGARRWRLIGGIVVGGAALVAISSALLGWRIWADFLGALRTVNGFFGIYGIVPTTMYNFKGTLALILGNDQGALINIVSLAALLAVASATLLLWRGPWAPEHPDFELRMALTFALGLLFCPHLHPQDGVMFIAPALIFYVYLRQRDLPRYAYAAFALSCPLIILIAEFTVGGGLGVRAPVALMGVLAIWMLKTLYRET